MLFNNTMVKSVSLVKPPRVVTSEEVELRLAPVYDRLKLSVGRLELMTGIHERRFWQAGGK